MGTRVTKSLVDATLDLRRTVKGLRFAAPITHVYDPLDYAWPVHRRYITTFATGPRRVVFLGMNPGPFGMAQTGVPFGEVAAVRDWMRLGGPVDAPVDQHPKRPVLGFDCPRSEVSGRRLWGAFAERFGDAGDFFADHYVLNYCPLVFMEASGRNRTPDKLPADERDPLFSACDEHLRRAVRVLGADWVVGIGRFAADRAAAALADRPVRIATVLHPSPANPRANRGWRAAAEESLVTQGVWS